MVSDGIQVISRGIQPTPSAKLSFAEDAYNKFTRNVDAVELQAEKYAPWNSTGSLSMLDFKSDL